MPRRSSGRARPAPAPGSPGCVGERSPPQRTPLWPLELVIGVNVDRREDPVRRHTGQQPQPRDAGPRFDLDDGLGGPVAASIRSAAPVATPTGTAPRAWPRSRAASIVGPSAMNCSAYAQLAARLALMIKTLARESPRRREHADLAASRPQGRMGGIPGSTRMVGQYTGRAQSTRGHRGNS